MSLGEYKIKNFFSSTQLAENTHWSSVIRVQKLCSSLLNS